MKTKTINLYSYEELSKESKEKALENWRKDNQYFFLEEDLLNRLGEYLDDAKIKKVGDPKVLFSLSHSQGDGVMFEGEFKWGKYTLYIKRYGRYCHSKSAIIEMQETDNLGFSMDDEDACVIDFTELYEEICRKLEKDGYDFIEYEDSEENFMQECNGSGYTFTSDGIMEKE